MGCCAALVAPPFPLFSFASRRVRRPRPLQRLRSPRWSSPCRRRRPSCHRSHLRRRRIRPMSHRRRSRRIRRSRSRAPGNAPRLPSRLSARARRGCPRGCSRGSTGGGCRRRTRAYPREGLLTVNGWVWGDVRVSREGVGAFNGSLFLKSRRKIGKEWGARVGYGTHRAG